MNTNHSVSLSNKITYEKTPPHAYLAGASHIKCPWIRSLLYETAVKIIKDIKAFNPEPMVLDLGAGEGSTSKIWLELGARVTAVDISGNNLNQMKEVCKGYENKLETICSDVFEFLEKDFEKKYDLVTTISFLHHIKDYLSLIQKVIPFIKPSGYFFSFEDPSYHPTLDFYSFFLSQLFYYCWRITQGDIIGGFYRKMRRLFVGYKDDVYDNTEYHAIRSGVDQESILNLLKNHGFSCSIGYYFSNQSPVLQSLGTKLKIRNHFFIIAKRV